MGLTKQDDNVRLVMGLGGCVQHVLMPYHYRTVMINGPPNEDWLEVMLTSLSQHGEIEKKVTKLRKWDCLLFVTFRNPVGAVNAVRTLEAPKDITIEPYLQYGSGDTAANFTLRIEWCRRERQNFAFIDFNCEEDLEIAKEHLFQNDLEVSGSLVKFSPSNKAEKLQLFVMNVDQQVTEEALKAAVEECIPGVTVTAHLGFEKSFETTPEQLAAMKKQLKRLIEKHATRGKYNLEIHPPMNYFKTYRAVVSFQNPEEGQKTLRGLRHRRITGKLLDVKLALHSSVRYTPAVYKVIEDPIMELKAELERRYGTSVCITEKQDKWGNIIVHVSSDNIQVFAVAKNVLNTVMHAY